jgi:hypothetical protein
MRNFPCNIPAVLVTVVMLAAFLIPVNLAMPYAVSADPGIMKWDWVATPGSDTATVTGRFDIANTNDRGSEIISMAVSDSSNTVGTVIKTGLGSIARDTATSSSQGIFLGIRVK